MQEMSLFEIEQLLDRERIGRLAMASLDSRPYTIPMPFCWHEGALYMRIPMTGRKGRVLQQNDQVCFEVDDYADDFSEYASVLIEGRLVEVTDVEEKLAVKQRNSEKYLRLRNGHRPGHGRITPIENLAMRKIVVTSISGRKKEAAGAYIRARD